MNPLAVEIWCCIGTSYVLVAMTIWLVARFSPFEWHPALITNSCDIHDHDGQHCNKTAQNAVCDHHCETDLMDDSSLLYDRDETDNAELLCIENDFTLCNSFWFTIGTLMQQGSDLNPKVRSEKSCDESTKVIYSDT